MKKTIRATYKKDKYYEKVRAAVDQLLQDGFAVIPVEVFIQTGNLTKEDYEAWRFGRIPYLERAIKCNLSKANRILHILRLYAEDRELRPSRTVYKQWGKGEKIRLRSARRAVPPHCILYSSLADASPSPAGDVPSAGQSGSQAGRLPGLAYPWRRAPRSVVGRLGSWPPRKEGKMSSAKLSGSVIGLILVLFLVVG
jgi:hypothetical protein